MLAYIVATIIITLIWATASHLFFPNKITIKEALTKFGIVTFICVVGMGVMYYSDLSDSNIINGQVTGKEKVRVSCSHSYPCRCRTVRTGKTTSTHCDTCYRHPYDYDWDVYTTVGSLSIERINPQGTREPPRWTAVIIGEPAAQTVTFTNYVKAAPNSLFSMKQTQKDTELFANLFPGYPQVYDYYRINRVLPMGITFPIATQLNSLLNDELKVLGPSKEVNIIVVPVATTNTQYRYALERAWLGGKKNDVIIILGISQYPKLDWIDVITFGKNSGNELLAVMLRDNIKALPLVDDPKALSNVITTTVAKNFKRKEMKDYEYLKNEYTPSNTQFMCFSIALLIILILLTILFFHQDVYSEEWSQNRWRR